MAVGKDSPSRRRSIAVTNQKKPIVPKGRRRAHSVVPGDRLSPLAKARRSLAPRKSILKASVSLSNNDSQPSSQPSQPLSQASSNDDGNATQSIEFTQDFRARIHDNTSRKSFGRRVSFAEHAQVRLFQIPDKNHTNGTDSPQSSPSAPIQDDNIPPEHFDVGDENDYPRPRRRSSIRQSFGSESEDMDLTTAFPNGYATGSAIAEEEFDEEFYDDMDVTDVIQGDLIKRRSLSLGGTRQPLSQISAIEPQEEPISEDNEDHTQSMEEDSQMNSDAASDQSGAMEFTVPLSHSLRPPPQEDQVWLALRQVTHSGDTPIEPEPLSDDDVHVPASRDGMDLDHAMERLRRARESFSFQPSQETSISEEDAAYAAAPPVNEVYQDNSLSSMDESLREDFGDGNRTLNLSKVFGRASLGGRMSMGYADSTMEESAIYGSIIQVAQAHSTPRPSVAPQIAAAASPEPAAPGPSKPIQVPDTAKPPVFHPPPSAAPTTSHAVPTQDNGPAIASTPFSFAFTPIATAASTSRAPSPSKSKRKPTFSAAFAPPTERPSPKKRISSVSEKRTVTSNEEGNAAETESDRPKPAKRQSLSSKPRLSIGGYNDITPKPPSPSKKTPLQAPASKTGPRASSSLRRPSGYFARRKSLAVTAGPSQASRAEESVTQAKSPSKSSRMSMGNAPSDAWKRFDKAPINVAIPSGSPKGKERAREEEVEEIISQTEERQEILPAHEQEIAQEQPTVHTDLHDDDADMELDETEEQPQEEEQDIPSISIKQFFTMTGVKFMDELTAPRRSVHHPSRQARDPSEISLAEYNIAMSIDIPQLDLYTRVSKDLQAWMEKSKMDLAQAEEEASKVSPELFVEYARADEEGQAELLHQLNLIRTNTRGLSRSDWYDWKLQWVEGLATTAEEAFQSLEEDAKALEVLLSARNDLVPLLEKQYQEILAELEKEQAEVADIEASDQDYLNELKASIAEQNIEVEALEAELVEANERLKWIEEHQDEMESEKTEISSAISQAKRILHVQGNSTRSEVFKLKDELESLEDLHMFRVVKVSSNTFEYIHASQFHISIPCRNFLPIPEKINISLLDKTRSKFKDEFPVFSELVLNCAGQLFGSSQDWTVGEMIHRLSGYWSCCVQLRLQLKLLNIKYPVEIVPVSSHAGFKAKALMMLPSAKAKAFISFIFSFDTFSRWPRTIDSLDCEVEIKYGAIDHSTILNAVQTRLQQASPSDNYACLLDACIEAQDVYQS